MTAQHPASILLPPLLLLISPRPSSRNPLLCSSFLHLLGRARRARFVLLHPTLTRRATATVLLGNPLPPPLMSSAASSFIIAFLSVSLLSFIKPPQPAGAIFLRSRCVPPRAARRCSASSRQSNRITQFHLGRFIFRCLLNSAFFSPGVAQRGMGSPPLSAGSRSISRLTCQLASLGISPAYRLPVSNFTTITVAKLAVFVRLSRLSFFLSHVTTSRVVARGDSRLTTNDCSVVLHPPSSMSFCFFIHRCPPLFLPLSFRFTSAVRASAST